MIHNIDLTDVSILLILYLLIIIILFIRYIFLSGAYHYIFRVVFRKKFENRFVVVQEPNTSQLKRELKLAVYSSFIFGLVGLGLLILWQNGLTKIYIDPFEYPLWYIPISIVAFLVLHDTYYYWLHKWMHYSKRMQRIHNEHHKSVDTTVLTSFSFHPVESFFQAIILPVIFVILPMNLIAILFVLFLMTVSAIINHAGVEIYPRSKNFNSFNKYIIGATHHDRHHKHAKKNLGLYFTFWDRLMKTEY